MSEEFGGPSVGSLALNRRLNELGVDARIYTTDLANDKGDRLKPSAIRGTGANVRAFPASRPFFLRNSWLLCIGIWSAVRGADLVHIHGQYAVHQFFVYLACRAFRKPYGVQLHGALETYERSKSKKRKLIFNSVIGKRVLRHASYVHFSAPSEAQRARDLVAEDQAVVIPLGAELSTEELPITALADRLPSRSEAVLYLGRFALKKRPELLLRAWAAAKRPEKSLLVFAGPDGEITHAELSSLAESLGVLDSVLFVGPVDSRQKAWLYRRSGTFVLPSENENFGLTIAEAMVGGCHVIVSEHVAAGQYLLEADSGEVLDSVDVDTLRGALERALWHPSDTKASGLRAMKFAQKELSWDRLARFIAETG
ncbi:glycosyltransferase [Sinomonas atrocyanea]|uniref:glycosyltransferase n=1 Tax=Sinomonas atrocyanea TaxID=37927 RepID=UPI001471651D|nr:glycosyltransferase [Sinomonas atrocyanea]